MASVAGGEDRVVGVRGVDLDVEEPVNAGVDDVGRLPIVVGLLAADGRLPTFAAVRGPEDLLAARVVEGRDDRGVRLAFLDAHRDVAEAALLRRDVGPHAVLEFPDRARAHRPGAGVGAVGEPERPVVAPHHAGGEEALRRVGDGRPGRAAVVGRVEARAFVVGDRDVGGALRGGVEEGDDHARAARCADGGEAFDAAPGDRAVVAPPEAVVPGAEQEPLGVVRVHAHPLAVATAVLVAPELDRHARDRERRPPSDERRIAPSGVEGFV